MIWSKKFCCQTWRMSRLTRHGAWKKETSIKKKYRFRNLSVLHICRWQTLGKLCMAREEIVINVTALNGFLLLIYEVLYIHHSFISIQPWRPGLAGTRAKSCDRYGSGTLHPGQVLGGSLPLLFPAFRRSHFSRQVPPSATTREILAAKGGTVGEKDVR